MNVFGVIWLTYKRFLPAYNALTEAIVIMSTIRETTRINSLKRFSNLLIPTFFAADELVAVHVVFLVDLRQNLSLNFAS